MSNSNGTALMLYFDKDLASYKPFFDNAWKGEIGKLAKGTELAEGVAVLTASWEGISGTHQMPDILMHVLDGAWKAGFSSTNDGELGTLLKFARGLAGEVCSKVVPELSPTQKNQLNHEITLVANRVSANAKNAQRKLPSETQWPELMSDKKNAKGLHLSLWGAQRLCYCGVYYAFEEYLRFVIGALLKNPDYEIKKLKSTVEDAKPLLTEAALNKIIDEPVTTALLVRNALAHGAGRETPQLRPLRRKHGIRVIDDVLQIFPEDTKRLFDNLKIRVLELTKEALLRLS